MEFAWSNEACVRRNALIEFVHSQFGNDPADLEPDCVFAADDRRRCAENGVLGLVASRTYGDAGLDPQTAVYLVEALGYACRDTGLTFAILSQMLTTRPAIELFGTDCQKETWFQQLIAVDHGAFDIKEDKSGSDTYGREATAQWVDAVRSHGAREYIGECEVERDVTGSVGGLVYSGASDIQRNIILRMRGL